MADLLRSRTSLLTFKCDGTTIIPTRGKHNSTTVKAVVDMLKYAEPEILYAGDEASQPSSKKNLTGDGLYVRIHVIDPPSIIDFTSCQSKTIIWFSKQLRGNKEHIVFTTSENRTGGLQTVIDIYVRGILVTARHRKIHKINQPVNRLDYAV